MRKEHGSALVLAIVVMALLAAVIIALSRNTDIDLFIGRNVRLMKQAFLWGDSGLEIAEELIGYSEYHRGDLDTTKTLPLNGTTYSIQYRNPPLYTPGTGNNTTGVDFIVDGTTVSSVNVEYLGSLSSDGTSIIFAAGFEGVGKGLAGGGAFARIYSLHATGVSDNGQSRKRSAEVYRSLSGGK
jgi:hypothetical protein